ncbi:hypothetical protein XFF4834R_chr00470 [Xanthomonas citri pv. fuscans]|nr:hypothetical protein XFF4834R_chr00470 [Xanthomonas citri pv. fuscans]
MQASQATVGQRQDLREFMHLHRQASARAMRRLSRRAAGHCIHVPLRAMSLYMHLHPHLPPIDASVEASA